MMKFFTSKTAPAATQTQTPVETGADMVSTLDKTASLLAQLQKKIAAVNRLSPRWSLLSRQIEQTNVALARHELEAERQPVAAVTETDLITARNEVGNVDQLLVAFQANLATAKATQQALADRLAPIEAEKAAALEIAAQQISAAKNDLNAALAGADANAEKAASNALFLAQNNTALTGPIQIRIDAIQGQLAAAYQAVTDQSDALETTQRARLIFLAEVALVIHDKNAQALFDAWLAARVAVDLASRSKPGAVFEKDCFNGRQVNGFVAQVSSSKHIVFGRNFDLYTNRFMPTMVWHAAYLAAINLPDFAVLALNADDLSDKAPEPEPAHQAVGEAQAI